jgi:hypothetical protein
MPCFNTVPISIIPPVSQGVAPLLWQNGNQITRLNIPLNPSFLVYDGTITRWGDGSSTSPVYLPNIQEVNGPTLTYLAGITSTGQLVKTLGVSGTALIGGAAGEVVYQTGPSTTGFTAVGTTGQLLSSNGASAPTWLNQSAIVAGSIASGVAGAVPYQTAPSTTSFTAAGTSGQVLLSNGTSAPTWSTNIAGQAGSVANGSVTPAKLSTGGPSWDTSGNILVGSAGSQIGVGIVTVGYYGDSTNMSARIPSSVGTFFVQIPDGVGGYNDEFTVNSGNIYAGGNPITSCPTTAKAWGGASSAGIINTTTYGVSTITRSGLGNYLVTMPVAINGYSIVATPDSNVGYQATASVISTTQLRIYTYGSGGASADAAFKFAVFGV